NKTGGDIDLALLTDGLRAEREQGITIDVAYKYFSTPKRKFIIADAPGHIQYTRNMVTGASNSEAIVILIDARNGVMEQTKRHSLIASLLKIPHVVVAINKMDLVNYSEEVYNNIVTDYANVARSIGLSDITFIPISAAKGDNIVDRSLALPWYTGDPLLSFLENLPLEHDINLTQSRFPVQYVIRPQTEDLHDYRGYAGRINSGLYKKGDPVAILPSGITTTIKAIEVGGKKVDEAFAPQSAVLHLEDNIDVSRGDMIVLANDLPAQSNELELLLCWMDTKPLLPGNKYLLQLNNRITRTVVKEIVYRLDVNTLEQQQSPDKVGLNDIVKLNIKTASPVVFDSYASLRNSGSAILIDETSNVTV
ncbi:MAG: sulfate adenylyltransferase, partial [Pedobacter sp.]